MPYTYPTPGRLPRHLATAAACLLLLSGCAHNKTSDVNQAEPGSEASAVHDIYDKASNQTDADVVRTGRYQLVPLAPTSGQRDLLRQAVSIDIPTSMNVSVQDGLVHVLKGTGLRLSPTQSRSNNFASPLPAVHHQLGPTTLSDALQILAGPAWRLKVDFDRRLVSFERRHPTQEPKDS